MQLTRLPRSGSICQICQSHLQRKGLRLRRLYTSSTQTDAHTKRRVRPTTSGHRTSIRSQFVQNYGPAAQRLQSSVSDVTIADIASSVGRLQKEADKILRYDGVPPEDQTLNVLKKFKQVADEVSGEGKNASNEDAQKGTPASALLSLEGKAPPSVSVGKTIDLIANLNYKIVKHPTVFISPEVLRVYTNTQCLLGRPQTIPEIFDLYATKPVPQYNSNPIEYRSPRSNAPANAIPTTVADTALNATIQAKDLSAALSIIETSFRAPSYFRAKIIKQALPPALGLGLAPLAAYAVASNLALLQSTVDPSVATPIAWAGILTYVGAVGTLGFVAVSTANDQMQRVTWVPGTGLWERWLREEERAAVDKVALAWGFKGLDRRGEEEGAEWEFLKEWVGVRGMILDKVSLMEGME
ncbi:MAG: hypothetical protein M1820_002351 [Bogoriella megaspora]|nr:MAG: hypothetical protein M1820_002351 [Bogoriella megaspora]